MNTQCSHRQSFPMHTVGPSHEAIPKRMPRYADGQIPLGGFQ
ncbi:hypothetical protein GGQ69_001290 [Micrococcus sp. TA1]|nr:hypothetical protein [Micrococcus sp. TA1]